METVDAILIGIAVGGTTSFISVWLSFRRFRAEKWWEFRARAYERVIEALHEAKASTGEYLAAEQEGREIDEKVGFEFSKSSHEARLEIARTADIGGFLLGNRARMRLKKFLDDRRTAADVTDWSVYLLGVWHAENACLEDIIEIARQELGIEMRPGLPKRIVKWACRDER